MTQWLQFAVLMLTIIFAAMRGEQRLTRIETKLDPLWVKFVNEKTADYEQLTDPKP